MIPYVVLWERVREELSRIGELRSIELLFGRHGTGKIPKVHADIALDWKNRLESSGLRVTGGWYRPAHDPAMNETAEDLDALTTRDPLE